MALKIQISGADALERLIGGDTELELEIRQAVAENFAKKHIKCLVQEASKKAYEQGIVSEFFKEVTTGTGYMKKTELQWNEGALNKLDGIIKEHTEIAIRTNIRDYIDQALDRSKIDLLIEQKAQWIAQSLSETVLSDRLDKLVEKKLKEKLGLK